MVLFIKVRHSTFFCQILCYCFKTDRAVNNFQLLAIFKTSRTHPTFRKRPTPIRAFAGHKFTFRLALKSACIQGMLSLYKTKNYPLDAQCATKIDSRHSATKCGGKWLLGWVSRWFTQLTTCGRLIN